LRQKKEKHILSREQEHFITTCMPTRRLLMMHWHHCEEVKQVTTLFMGSVNDDIITLLNICYFLTINFLGVSDRQLYNYRWWTE